MSSSISPQLKRELRLLAQKYETVEFLVGDPSQFMHRYSDPRDIEIVALLSAVLSFGKRSEILSHIERFLLLLKGDSPSEWLQNGHFRNMLPNESSSFYRIFSYRNLRFFCATLQGILQEHGTLGKCLRQAYLRGDCTQHPGRLAGALASCFPEECVPLISKCPQSASKRLNLFLRWMVRTNSPVDCGLWNWYPCSELLIPMDTHVVAVAKKWGLLPPNAGTTLKYARILTETLKRVFPEDPVKGDFALFGSGVNDNGVQRA